VRAKLPRIKQSAAKRGPTGSSASQICQYALPIRIQGCSKRNSFALAGIRHTSQPCVRSILRSMKTPSELASLPDEDLMLMVANGFIEQPATELFRRHNRALFNFIAWQCRGNTQEAEDITQRTWEKIMTRCTDYQPSASFRTFLFQIARNLWLDLRRSAAETLRDEIGDDAPELPAEDLDPASELALRQHLNEVHKALLALPTKQREVVVLRFFSDMSLEEIAHTLGEGFETVKSRLRYAFANLRRVLEARA